MMQLSFDDPRSMEPESAAGLMADALAWIDANPGAWKLLVEWAYRDAARYGRVRIKSYIEVLRDRYPEIAPYVPIRSSKCDGVVTG